MASNQELVGVAREFETRREALETLANKLERSAVAALAATPRIDRIGFRVKDTASFAKKALSDKDGNPKYTEPYRQIEDQIGGRVLVFFLSDLEPVRLKLREAFGGVEDVRKEPEDAAEFGYESDHLIFAIPPHLRPGDWEGRHDVPTTFEMQVRTLFQHAWAEPQHDLGYKGSEPLSRQLERELAWAAASAWGADHAFDRVWREVSSD